MQTRNRFFDDIAKVANTATGTVVGLKAEIENMVRYRLEGLMSDMNMVSREEFDAVKAMTAKARSEQESLKKKIEELEAKLRAPTPTPREKKKTAASKRKAKR